MSQELTWDELLPVEPVFWTAIVESRVKMAPLILRACEEPPQILLFLLFCFHFIDERGKAYPKGKLRTPWEQFQMILSAQSVHGLDCGNQAVSNSCQVDEELECFLIKGFLHRRGHVWEMQPGHAFSLSWWEPWRPIREHSPLLCPPPSHDKCDFSFSCSLKQILGK